jgi:hypothetical protein
MFLATKASFWTGGKNWAIWNRFSKKSLNSKQNKDGSWPATPAPMIKLKDQDAQIYNSAMALLCLTVYYRYIPSHNAKIGKISKSLPIEEKKFNGLDYVNIKKCDSVKFPTSTFPLKKNVGEYSKFKKTILNYRIPSPLSVKTESVLNHFRYKLSKDNKHNLFDVNFEMAQCPWKKMKCF